MRTNTALRVGSVLLALVVGGAVGACSNNDDDGTTAASFPKACAAQAKVVDLVSALPTGGPTSPPADKATIKAAFPPVARAITALEDAMPEQNAAVTKVLTTLKAVGKDGDASALEELDSTAADKYFYDHCADTDQDRAITAKEYEYDGGTEAVEAGVLRVKLHNAGQQLHEMVLMRVKDGSTLTKDQVMALAAQGDDAVSAKLDFVNATIAPQGQDGYLAAKVDKGSYVMVCMLPVGATSFEQLQSGQVDGPPHLSQGMMRSFTVS
jgi:hypothetical protein